MVGRVVPSNLFDYDETFMNMVDDVFPESKSKSVNHSWKLHRSATPSLRRLR